MRAQGTFLLIMAAGSVGFLASWMYIRSSHDGAEAPLIAATVSRPRPATQQLEAPSSPEKPAPEPPAARVPMTTDSPSTAETSPAGEPDVPTPGSAEAAPDPRTLPEVTIDEMRRKRDAIWGVLNERSQPLLIERFEGGHSEKVSDDGTWSQGDPNTERTEIYSIRMIPDQGTYRTVLPREQYPELYALKDETLRLDELINAEELRRALEATAPK